MNAIELLQYGAEILKTAGIEDWDYDSRVLLEWICHLSRIDLILYPSQKIETEQENRFKAYIHRRALHEPLQYLIGEWEFMGLPFKVNPSVLIPRQDTECLIEWILQKETSEVSLFNKSEKYLDVCTGSGCIAVSLYCLLKEHTSHSYQIDALDISKKALETAKANSQMNKADVHFYESDMFDKITDSYDVIVSNPPYIPSKVVDGLMDEVVKFEPRLALDGMDDGLHFYRILAKEGKNYLKPGGRLYLEIGHDQGETVPKLLSEEGFVQIEVRKDLAGNDRCVRAVFPE